MRKAILAVVLCVARTAAFGAEEQKTPYQMINALLDRMYVVGETNGKLQNFLDAEKKAAAEISRYIQDGNNPNALVEKGTRGQTPLILAAFAGYPDVVSELLKSDAVRNSIEVVDDDGRSAWTASNTAFFQTAWLCQPKLLNDIAFITFIVQLPYYYLQPENPYQTVRSALENAGAKQDLSRAKSVWEISCPGQSDETRERVRESGDLLETLKGEGLRMMEKSFRESESPP